MLKRIFFVIFVSASIKIFPLNFTVDLTNKKEYQRNIEKIRQHITSGIPDDYFTIDVNTHHGSNTRVFKLLVRTNQIWVEGIRWPNGKWFLLADHTTGLTSEQGYYILPYPGQYDKLIGSEKKLSYKYFTNAPNSLILARKEHQDFLKHSIAFLILSVSESIRFLNIPNYIKSKLPKHKINLLTDTINLCSAQNPLPVSPGTKKSQHQKNKDVRIITINKLIHNWSKLSEAGPMLCGIAVGKNQAQKAYKNAKKYRYGSYKSKLQQENLKELVLRNRQRLLEELLNNSGVNLGKRAEAEGAVEDGGASKKSK